MQVVRFAPLVPLAFVTFLFGCSTQSSVTQQPQQYQNSVTAQSSARQALHAQSRQSLESEEELAEFSDDTSYQLPLLADSILERGKSLIGTRYRFGGNSTAGFDCSGFIGYLFREEAGMNLPRSSREMMNIDAPQVSRRDLKPGDLLFFSTAGRGRISHAAIYLGDDQFIHSSSRRSGGVRIDSLDDSYWSKTFVEAKRALALVPATGDAQTTAMTTTSVKPANIKRHK
ncbi:C40 family peptidase [Pseudomonas sp. DTU_2021_1001937_2_SI_NGA_ILE_001]|uniref:C40 family peptidase n=1 Tax=Pseudomonas sp. DTU_2021_1001937_2_SI_NGA_ILE_001 TaxID=3077589 RepID=UPI002600EEA2|nr:C40 family peptidase [Pseudomonas sp. DTU_2021_1001937_2_SI_NGA_ILE_001]WNW11430.1 C40 family peptidase [Pseudomonas sp. DTU_2021_1001937_2_SI_NGA_ILE_001]